jgi:hypothetical protein
MKRLVVKLLILLGATGLLPWVAFFIGQVGSRVALYAHVAGVGAIMMMKIYDLFKSRKRDRAKTLDDPQTNAVNESNSDLPPAA